MSEAIERAKSLFGIEPTDGSDETIKHCKDGRDIGTEAVFSSKHKAMCYLISWGHDITRYEIKPLLEILEEWQIEPLFDDPSLLIDPPEKLREKEQWQQDAERLGDIEFDRE